MECNKNLVHSYMRLSPVFIYETDTLYNAIQAMKNFTIDKISIIKEDFSIVGYIDTKKIREIIRKNLKNNIDLIYKTQIKDVLTNPGASIVLYPKMKVLSAYSAMKCLKTNCLPVVSAPWEKKIIGFLWLDDILPIVEENYLRVPV